MKHHLFPVSAEKASFGTPLVLICWLFNPFIASNWSQVQLRQVQNTTRGKNVLGENSFLPAAVVILGMFGMEAQPFFKDIGQCITTSIQNLCSYQYLVQRIVVVVQRGNEVNNFGDYFQWD